MLPDDPRHGTEAGNEQHIRDGETPCEPCYDAKLRAARRRTKRKTMGHKYRVPLGDLHAVIVDLNKRGATDDLIGKWAGISSSQVWRIRTGTPDTLIAPRTRDKLATMRRGRIITPLGITRRLQALTWLGYSAQRIAEASGVHTDTIRDALHAPRDYMKVSGREAIADVYDRLSMTPADGATKQERAGASRARNKARRLGWAAPLCWEDIDDPNETPAGTYQAHRAKTEIDEAVVLRILAGEHVDCTTAERDEVMRRWRDAGKSERELCLRMGWQPGRYGKGRAA